MSVGCYVGSYILAYQAAATGLEDNGYQNIAENNDVLLDRYIFTNPEPLSLIYQMIISVFKAANIMCHHESKRAFYLINIIVCLLNCSWPLVADLACLSTGKVLSVFLLHIAKGLG